MARLILRGDSIFDNAGYVAGGPSVIDHMRRALPAGWSATLLAQDGGTTEDVPRQIRQAPADAAQRVISAGGSDALQMAGCLLQKPADSLETAMKWVQTVRETLEGGMQR